MSTLTALISGGGGGGESVVPVNGIAQLNVDENLYTDSEGREWLRNGALITTGLENYPDAEVKNDLISLSYSTSAYATLSPNKAQGSGFCFSEDGLIFYYLAYASYVYQYTLSVPYIINSKIGAVKTAAISNDIYGAIQISLDGTKLYLTSGTNLKYYTLSTPYDITTFTFIQNVALGGSSKGFSFSNDGLKLFVAQGTTGIKEFNLVSAWNPIGMTASGNVAAAGLDTYDITWKEDGTKFYIIYASAGTAAEYNCSIPFSFAGTETQVGTKANVADGSWGKRLFLVPDGTGKTFLAADGDNNSPVVSWTAATAYTISTAAIPGSSFPAYQTATGTAYAGQAIIFSYSGGKVYAQFNSDATYLYEFTCPTPFDLITAVYNGVFIYLGNDTQSFTYFMQWSNDGNNLNIYNSGFTDSRDLIIFKTSVPYSLAGMTESSVGTTYYGGVIVNNGYQTVFSTGTSSNSISNFGFSGQQYVPIFSSSTQYGPNIPNGSNYDFYNIVNPSYSNDGKYIYSRGKQYLLETPFSTNITNFIAGSSASVNQNIPIIDYDGYFGINYGLYKKLNYIGFFSGNVNDFVRIK